MKGPQFFWRSTAGDCGRVLRRSNDGRMHGGQKAGEDLFNGESLRERFVGRHDAVTQDIGCDVEYVLRQDIGTSPHESERTTASDKAK